MGIRFNCPNGHHLHVKAFLAGRRGICPDCGARLLIPTESQSGPADAAAGQTAATNESIHIKVDRTRATIARRGRVAGRRVRRPTTDHRISPTDTVQMVATMTPAAPNPTEVSTVPGQPAASNPPIEATQDEDVWYVRPPAGGQYGPASNETLAKWIREGRIVRDAYVWRDGWSTWQLAGKVTDRLPATLPDDPSKTADPTVAGSKPTLGEQASAAVAEFRRARRRSSRRQWLAAIALLVLVIVLTGLLIWVLNRGPL